jgi:hypothetical protein
MYGAARRIAGWALALPLVAGLGCYPNEFDNNSYQAVATVRDTLAVFSTAATYALADSVVHLTPPGSDDELSRIYDQQILDRIRTNMTAKGYTEVVDPNAANLHLLALATSSTYYGYYWDSWCGYYGWWYPAYGCGYPSYWYTYDYTVGTLLIGMTDHRAMTNNKAPMIWFAGLNGLVDQTTLPEIYAGIDQAFTQSPYIHHP